MNQFDLKSEKKPIAFALRPILFSLLILISGIIIGAGVTLITTVNSGTPQTLPPAPEHMSRRMVNRIARELHLSPEQREHVDPIVQKHMEAMDEIRNQARPKISQELKEMNEEILSILDERQKQIWQDKVKQMQDHFTRMRQRRRPGNGLGRSRNKTSGPWRDPSHQSDQFHAPAPVVPLPPQESRPFEDKQQPPDEF